MATPTGLDQQVGYILGKLDNLATKDDLASQLKWLIALQLTGMAVFIAIMGVVVSVVRSG